jgi:hypothetical protein
MGTTNLDTLAVNGLTLGDTVITASAAELNLLDGVTASAAELNLLDGVTAAASKAVVLDANKAVSGMAQPVLTKSADYTVTTADSGAVIVVTGVDKVMTLPATAAGLLCRFVLASAGLSSGTGLSISPAAADKIMGNGFTSADNKDAVLAGSGDREGDSITLVGDGADGWYIVAVTGTWTREA